MSRERFDVMGVEIAASCVAAFLAREPVARKDVVSPLFVSRAETCISTFGHFAVFVRVACWAAFGVRASRNADFRTLRHSQCCATAKARASLFRETHSASRVVSVMAPLERGHTALGDLSAWHASRCKAMGRAPVSAIAVDSESLRRVPSATGGAPFVAACKSFQIVVEGEPEARRRYFLNANEASHRASILSGTRDG